METKEKIITIICILLVGLAIDYKLNQPKDPYYRCMHAGESVGFIRSGLCDALANNSYDLTRYIDVDDIVIMENGFYVTGDFFYGQYSNTDSMLPVLDAGSTGIYIYRGEDTQINLGDIVAFKADGTKIAHRIIKQDIDEEGIYYITKGDNNIYPDDFKVRPYNIQGILVGVIW